MDQIVLESEPKISDAWSWIQSLKIEFRMHSPAREWFIWWDALEQRRRTIFGANEAAGFPQTKFYLVFFIRKIATRRQQLSTVAVEQTNESAHRTKGRINVWLFSPGTVMF